MKKVKSLIAAALIVSSVSAFAVDLTLSPVYTIVGIVRSAVVSVVAPTAITAASTMQISGQNKEQLEAVRSDAVDFLAGAQASNVLKASISEIKTKSAELNEMSDAQVAGLIVTALE
ncbi:MAG: hypothetical protein H7336_00485 [Bacteriovorax sp.]|nr:hypothetical protein [Bacteriovorax sp.]